MISGCLLVSAPKVNVWLVVSIHKESAIAMPLVAPPLGFRYAREGDSFVDMADSEAGEEPEAPKAGEVVYAGNSVPSFGNMVLLRHEGGWVTVYAHLASLDVKMRQTVAQGQTIGAVGQTGGVSSGT